LVQSDIDFEVVNSFSFFEVVNSFSFLKLLTKSGEIKPFFSVSPLLPKGIHVTSDNNIIVGVKEPGPPTPTDKSTRALLIFGMDGKQQHTYNGFISPDFVKSFTSELLPTDRSMSLFEVNVMLLMTEEICFVVVMLSLSMFICLMTCLL
jgi:hypothetical protein